MSTTQLRTRLPQRLFRLADLATDLWWASSTETRALFKMISASLWRQSQHNPVQILNEVSSTRLAELAVDPIFLQFYDDVIRLYDRDISRLDTTVAMKYPEMQRKTIAYFSAEYGLHSSLPIYSGGLGILAGDHVKTAGDVGLNLIAVGFLYPYGYFEQHIASDGKQVAEYRHLDKKNTPLELVYREDGTPLIITLHPEGEADELHLQLWRLKVGRANIILMDSDIEINSVNDREITKRLYGGDKLYRLRQELALGIGGVRALEALGIRPDVWHANEGHAAFLFSERLRTLVNRGEKLEDAAAHVRSTSIFTTHTPVPAGHDAFDFSLIARFFPRTIRELGMTEDEFFALGKHQESYGEAFNMTTLAMNMTEYRNGVSKKHGEVTREMWSNYSNIGSVTNGVHVATWLAQEWAALFTTFLSPDWKRHLCDEHFWRDLHSMPDDMFWGVRRKLNDDLRRHTTAALRYDSTANSDEELILRGALFDPNAFTIGFARRFATYKRASLLFRDPDRLSHLLMNTDQRVQFVFSGKAHPADMEGQALIREIWDFIQEKRFKGKIFFLENYQMHTAKFLVQGVDLWLNSPRVPMEASGTSGMKAAINGVPNLSVLDGWWCEGYNGRNGWAVTSPESLTPEEQDAHDADAIYTLLEREVVPLYYDRDLMNIPHGWVQVAKDSMSSLIPRFTSERMLGDYIENYYSKAAKR